MNQFGGSRTDTLVKLVLIFFISLLSFSVGTYVGKNVTESQYKLSSLESSLNDETAHASNEEPVEMKDDETLTDEDIASLTDEFANAKKEEGKAGEEHGEEAGREVASAHGNDPHAEKPAAAAPAKKPAAHHGEADHAAPAAASKPAAHAAPAGHAHAPASTTKVATAAERVATGKSPSEAPKAEVPKAETLPKEVASSTTGKYTVQIAAYMKEDEAIKKSEELKAQGYSAFYVTAQVNGKTWYRVSVGLFQSPSSAVEFKTELMKKANLQSAIVQKLVN